MIVEEEIFSSRERIFEEVKMFSRKYVFKKGGLSGNLRVFETRTMFNRKSVYGKARMFSKRKILHREIGQEVIQVNLRHCDR